MNAKEAVEKYQEIYGLENKFEDFTLQFWQMKELKEKGILEPFWDDCQNDSPSLGELYEYAEKGGWTRFEFSGYSVPTTRSDCRLTVHTIRGAYLTDVQLQSFIDAFRLADEFEINLKDGSVRAWWD